jgi:hypothetical protein
MNPENRWIIMPDQIPWDQFEKRYARIFSSSTRICSKISTYGSWFLNYTNKV